MATWSKFTTATRSYPRKRYQLNYQQHLLLSGEDSSCYCYCNRLGQNFPESKSDSRQHPGVSTPMDSEVSKTSTRSMGAASDMELVVIGIELTPTRCKK